MTGLVDPGARTAAGPGGRPHQAAVDGWLQARPRDWLAQVGTAALDPRRGYPSALITPLGHATVVGDTSTPSGSPTRWRPGTPTAKAGHPRSSGPHLRPAVTHPQVLVTAAEQLTELGRAWL